MFVASVGTAGLDETIETLLVVVMERVYELLLVRRTLADS